MKEKKHCLYILLVSIVLLLGLSSGDPVDLRENAVSQIQQETDSSDPKTGNADYDGNIPEYNGNAYIVINNNIPYFSEAEKRRTDYFEDYSELDDLGRCGQAFANVCIESMPTEERGAIGQIKPSGWHTVKYNNLIDGNYLYNRCHLIGHQLAGENANEKNLITGTRYLNLKGMLPFENAVAAYIKETSNHVLYRVTPKFEDNNLVASGVQIEAWSVEDQGEGICCNVYCYNVQPYIVIDYATGESSVTTDGIIEETNGTEG